MSVHVYVDSSAAYLHRRDIRSCMSHPVRHLFPFSSFEEISKNAFVILICTLAQLAYILRCVIKTVVLTYKLVLQYVFKHFMMSSFKKCFYYSCHVSICLPVGMKQHENQILMNSV